MSEVFKLITEVHEVQRTTRLMSKVNWEVDFYHSHSPSTVRFVQITKLDRCFGYLYAGNRCALSFEGQARSFNPFPSRGVASKTGSLDFWIVSCEAKVCTCPVKACMGHKGQSYGRRSASHLANHSHGLPRLKSAQARKVF